MPDLTSRSLHDIGLAGWFGGSLANAVALNSAAQHASDAQSRGAVANTGWKRWTRSMPPPSPCTWSAASASSRPTGTASGDSTA